MTIGDMKLKGNKTIYYIALVAYAALLLLICSFSAALVGLDKGGRIILYAFFLAFAKLFLWSKKYIAKWLGIKAGKEERS